MSEGEAAGVSVLASPTKCVKALADEENLLVSLNNDAFVRLGMP